MVSSRHCRTIDRPWRWFLEPSPWPHLDSNFLKIKGQEEPNFLKIKGQEEPMSNFLRINGQEEPSQTSCYGQEKPNLVVSTCDSTRETASQYIAATIYLRHHPEMASHSWVWYRHKATADHWHLQWSFLDHWHLHWTFLSSLIGNFLSLLIGSFLSNNSLPKNGRHSVPFFLVD